MGKPFSQACENNKRPILEVLQRRLVDVSSVLEIGSGTGQHAVFFAEQLPHLQWRTSDLVENHAAIRQWIDEGCRETATSKPGIRAETGPAFEPVPLPSSRGAVLPQGARPPPVWSTFRANTVTALAARPSAPLVAVAGHEQVTLYGLERDEVLAVLPFPEGQVHSLRCSPSGSILIGGGGRAVRAQDESGGNNRPRAGAEQPGEFRGERHTAFPRPEVPQRRVEGGAGSRRPVEIGRGGFETGFG